MNIITNNTYSRFEVFAGVKIQVQGIGVVTPYGVVAGYQCVGESCMPLRNRNFQSNLDVHAINTRYKYVHRLVAKLAVSENEVYCVGVKLYKKFSVKIKCLPTKEFQELTRICGLLLSDSRLFWLGHQIPYPSVPFILTGTSYMQIPLCHNYGRMRDEGG
jgi:hypothetical protein